MALLRSASGPGGLSINTDSANSIFGSNTTAPTANMFGSTQAKPTGSIFGTAPTTASSAGSVVGTAQPQQSGGFGSSQPQQSGGIFGSTPSSQPSQAGGIFGSINATSQPQQTGGGFGSLGNHNVTSQPAQSGGLFSSLNTQNANKPATSMFGGLGSTQNQQQQAQPKQTSLFSSLGQSQQQQPQQQSQGSNMLGSTISRPLGSVLGRSLQPQVVPGVRIDLSNIRGTTRFNDLQEDLQKEIQRMDEVIQAQIQLKNQCDAIMPAHDSQLAGIPVDVDYVQRKLVGVEEVLEEDAKAISQGRQQIEIDSNRAVISFKTIDNLKLPPQYHNSGLFPSRSGSATNRTPHNGEEQLDLVAFFSTTADESSSTLDKYQKNFVEVEQHLRSLEASSAQQTNLLLARRNGSSARQEDPTKELGLALVEFEESLLGVASKVGKSRQGIQTLQLGEFMPNGGERTTNGKRSGI